MIFVVGNLEFPLDDRGNPLARPDFAPEAIGRRPIR